MRDQLCDDTQTSYVPHHSERITTMAFDLRAAINDMIDATGETNPAIIADKVAHDVPSQQVRTVLALALRPAVRDAFAARQRANPILHNVDYCTADTHGRRVDAVQPTSRTDHGLIDTHSAPVGPRAKQPFRASRKVSAIRQHSAEVTRWLADAVSGLDAWKSLGECTYDDLMNSAEYRRQLAAGNLAQADRYAQLADDLKAAGAATVADLPDDVLLRRKNAA